MKKIYVLAVIVLLMFTACKKGSDSPTAPSAASSINYGDLDSFRNRIEYRRDDVRPGKSGV